MNAKHFCDQIGELPSHLLYRIGVWGRRTLVSMSYGAPITSRSNARVKALRAAFAGKASKPGDLVAIEGGNLIGEAWKSNLEFDTVYVREGCLNRLEWPAPESLRPNHWAILSKDVFDSSVDTVSPQGVAATVAIPSIEVPAQHERPGVVLVLEDLQDPGNLGTLIRSAEAFGMRGLFITPGTVNPWNPKTIRASAGSVFRMPIVRAPLDDIRQWLQEHRFKLAAAVARSAGATPAMHARLLAPCALMVGNEGAGLSGHALELAHERVHIPCAVESLNAATAGTTLMYEAFRQNLLQEFMDIPVAQGLQ
jgi:TrmH family RNA methyltransferase